MLLAMRFGAVLPHNEIRSDPVAIRAYLEGLERLGVTHLLAYDHVLGADRDREGGFSGPYDKDVAFHEPLTFFAYAAAVTSRLEFMSAVLILPQRQTALVAKQAAEVAILSGNRLRLGIGTGWNRVEYDALNENFRNRGKREADQVRLLRRLWSESSLSYQSDYHQIDRAGLNPRPSAPIPIWFGGSAPALLERCAELGDGWVPVEGPNERTKGFLETIRSHREADQVELLRRLWSEETLSYESPFHTVERAGINPRPARPIPIWFGGTSDAALARCGRVGDGFIPLGGANEASRAAIATIRDHREAAGRSMDGFGIQAQAQYSGGNPERWRSHAQRWEALGATHLAIATHNAGPTDVDGHLTRVEEYLTAVRA
jgi:probable F420-dependent oxidoreductase